jgi:solute carrier family 8 (sodium/calcium exchanger)
VFLLWLFLGIARIADIFMEAIEVVTSATKRIEVYDKKGD